MDIQEFVIKIADQFEESEVKNINENVDFKQLGTWDSLTSMSVQLMIKDEYSIIVNPDDLNHTKTVLDLFNLVLAKKLQQ